jgi:hypothetical protein
MLEAPPMYDDYVSYIRDSNMYMNKVLRILLLKNIADKRIKEPHYEFKNPSTS